MTVSTSPVDIPRSSLDVFTDAALLDPWAGYRELRDQGPVVFLDRYGMHAATRYSAVSHILRTPDVFISGEGVMMNDESNQMIRGNTLCSDGEEHATSRGVVVKPLTPKALRPLQEEIRTQARDLVDRLTARGQFDAVTDLAQYLPVTIVSNLVGLPEEGRERMLLWASESFNSCGPLNERALNSFPVLGEMVEYATTQAVPGKLKPGSWAEAVFLAADRGEVAKERCPMMMMDYMGPSLDTTIFAISSAVWLFARHPDQWDLIRQNPSLIPGAINEVLRMESPLQCFSRKVAVDTEVDGVALEAGSRVITYYGAANRDERQYPEPDRFDITRNPTDHLGFGAGPHACVGMNLARLEMRSLFEELAAKVERFEVLSETRALNNVLRGFASLDVAVHV
ncbi:cytochrome P450 [Rhodococcus sp. OK302]|uniref:cytochrome P450 n=1 Tax=Rhodococcus sp. OK302 TaxID=1882769 RepID=UPI000B944BB6|nr:cytochrome P450 [Rhodococcus sp. OK302]OYD70992.1 cytochrome P450 [Rhodococcus sp. OK302]